MNDQTTSKPIGGRRAFLRKLAIDLSIMTVIGVVLALIGPFGSFVEPLPLRLTIWLLFAYIGYAIYSPMSFVVERVGRALDLPKAPLWVAAVAIATIPMTAAVWMMNFIGGTVPWPSLEQALTQYFYVLVIGGGITAVFFALDQRRGQDADAGDQTVEPQPTASSAQPHAVEGNPLLAELPAEIGSEVIALEMEDHYVRVHTVLGSTLILMRMRDAAAHLSDIDGRLVHRSWWVARGAVEDVTREGRNVRLVLAGGIEAPVSRAQVSELKEAGWI